MQTPAMNRAVFWSVQVCGIRKKKASHMFKKLAQVPAQVFGIRLLSMCHPFNNEAKWLTSSWHKLTAS